jgi:hypothetical protein
MLEAERKKSFNMNVINEMKGLWRLPSIITESVMFERQTEF